MSIQTVTHNHFLPEDGLALASVSSELTVSQARAFIHTSERHLNDLLDAGKIAFRINGSERLVLRDSLLEFERQREMAHVFLNELLEMY